MVQYIVTILAVLAAMIAFHFLHKAFLKYKLQRAMKKLDAKPNRRLES